MGDLVQALAAWRAQLGSARVLDSMATRQAYASSTAARATLPAAVLLPHNEDELRQVLQVALACATPLYPVSCGHNWGYGDACAPSAGQVVVDLSGMRRILEVNTELAYAVLEPGVTQGQLSRHLREQRLPLWMDCTGAGPDTSLVGNVLERGFGHTPYGNRVQTIAGMRVLLADGSLVETGFGHFRDACNARVFPYGPGPWLDGLFTQSNFGIVTRLGLWLMPQTQAINHLLCSVAGHAQIAAVVDALRPLRLDGTLRSILHLGNDLRVISGGRVFPRDLAGEAERLPEALRQRWRREAGIGAWTVSGALYGSPAQLAATRRAIRQALRGTGVRPRFLSERQLAAGEFAARLLGGSAAGQRLRAQLALGRALFEMNRGIPNGRFLAGAYWRRRGGLPAGFPEGADPARDNCGMMWVSPVLPLRGADLLRVYGMAEAIFQRHRFDLFATFSMISERALGGVLTIAYDKEDGAESARAQACYDELFGRLMQAGYIPYRVGLQSMDALDNGNDSYWDLVRRLKAALDPAGILAPGRYQPRRRP
ncbi:FAD-binding oxidoreductase [Massilia sp. MB5]|uniref:FAD-binding oxidoreductase n=1 Tax=Massilia sp. MB5 TaxID=2919578 RepID=UPI001F0CFDA8|nr:FAD-binding oxidoreductase [Massilia sp. MB5]UMR29332.1 FAD-binding oxidoreductase [Massilia sp. MB5]